MGYKELKRVKKELQGVTGGYRGLQGVTGGYNGLKGLEWVTRS